MNADPEARRDCRSRYSDLSRVGVRKVVPEQFTFVRSVVNYERQDPVRSAAKSLRRSSSMPLAMDHRICGVVHGPSSPTRRSLNVQSARLNAWNAVSMARTAPRSGSTSAHRRNRASISHRPGQTDQQIRGDACEGNQIITQALTHPEPGHRWTRASRSLWRQPVGYKSSTPRADGGLFQASSCCWS